MGINFCTDLRRREISLSATGIMAFVRLLSLQFGRGAGFAALSAEYAFSILPGGLLAAASLLTGGDPGMGDALLLTVIGLYFPPVSILMILGRTLLLVGLWGIAGLLSHRGKEIPMVPFLCAACLGELL
ncbi:MAG: hypothetical protein IJX90_10875 [Blautia sp.]|nr:hypothetical protein [Blautia sp.]